MERRRSQSLRNLQDKKPSNTIVIRVRGKGMTEIILEELVDKHFSQFDGNYIHRSMMLNHLQLG